MAPSPPPQGASGRPMPHPAGTGRATDGEVEDWRGGPSLLLLHWGGGEGCSHLSLLCPPVPYGEKALRSPHTCSCASLPHVFLQSPPRVWDWDLGGRSPGAFDSLLPWPDLILGYPGFSTTSASLKPLCQGLLPPSGVGVQPLFEGQVMVQRKPGLRVGPGGV